MGLGGYLLWTAVAREVSKKYGKVSLPYENHGQHNVMVQSAVFQNNPPSDNTGDHESMEEASNLFVLSMHASHY